MGLDKITGESNFGSVAAGKRQCFQSPKVLGRGRKEVDIGFFRQRNIIQDPIQSSPDQQSKGKVGIGCAIWAAKLKAAVFPIRSRNSDQLGAVITGPGYVFRCLIGSQSLIRTVCGVQKQRHIRNMLQDAAHRPVHDKFVAALDRDIDMETASGILLQRLGRKVCIQAITGCTA